MSIRNMDADLATNKLNELFHLHRYEDCVLFLNRLSHNTIRLVIEQISVDMYLSRLPYTIEIFEALYAKIFIINPDNFPTRNLQPERLIDKMVAYFSLLNDQSAGMEPIDGPRLLDSFENVIRVISYVQPSLYSRLLYFKYAIDKGLLRFETDLALFNSHQKLQTPDYLRTPGSPSIHASTTTDALSISGSTPAHLGYGTLSKRSNKLKVNALANALLITRAYNMQTCESMREEIVRTVGSCEKALTRLNEFIAQLKSQKIFREVQFFLNQQQEREREKDKENVKGDGQQQEGKDTTGSSAKSTPRKTSKGVRSASRSTKSRSESVNGRFSMLVNDSSDTDEVDLIVGSSTICQDFIQNRLYLNKAMMNTVDKYLETVRLHQALAEVGDKIDLDKEILLVFTHLKQEEKHLSSVEPLQPLFRRYSLGFERCIQIWRRKCSADSLLLFNDRFNYQPHQPHQTQQQPFEQLYVCNQTDSNNIDRLHSSFSSSAALAAKMPSKAYEFMQQEEQDQGMLMNASSAAAANSFLKRSSTDVFNRYSSVVDSCLSTSVSSQNTLGSHRHRAKGVYIYKTGSQPPGLMSSEGSGEVQRGIYEVPPNDSEFFDKVIIGETGGCQQADKTGGVSNSAVQSYQEQVRNLQAELAQARGKIEKLKANENELKQKLQEKINEQLNDSSTHISSSILRETPVACSSSSSVESCSTTSDRAYTAELIILFNNLNKHYRLKANDSLDSVKEIKSMQEFKIKLLFSVVILAYRYCKFYVKDLKRKVKALLQINDRNSYSSSSKSSAAPTIIVHGDIDNSTESEIEVKKRKRLSERHTVSKPEVESTHQIIENALDKYLYMVTMSKSFDLNKINEEVKEQLWNTLYDYPLKECIELNSYINEAVKTCWALINHQPLIKLGFSDLKFDQSLHQRDEELSNSKNEQIVQFVWPSLIDSSNNSCLCRGIVIT